MSRQTFLNALARKNPPGHFSVGTGTSIACQELMQETGVWFPQAHTDAEAMAALAIAGHTVLGMDVVMPLYSVCHEAAALGCNVQWGSPDSMPESGKPIWSKPSDVKVPADFLDHPACRTPLKAISLLKKRLGDSAAVCGKVFGGWTLGYHLFGVENFLMGTLDDPAATREIIDKLTPATIAFARAQAEAGADCVLVGDHATRDLCSPEAYRDFLLGLHTRLAREIPIPCILHICGNTSDRIGMIAKTGLACFHWDTKTGTPQEVRRLAGDRMSLMGGVSNMLLLGGKPEEITAAAKAAAAGGIDIVGPECAVPLKTPLANLKAIAACRPRAAVQ
jgi:[methyl-Co(III) methanol-specific corrinoid protein]:coenzyme M methyltransferase